MSPVKKEQTRVITEAIHKLGLRKPMARNVEKGDLGWQTGAPGAGAGYMLGESVIAVMNPVESTEIGSKTIIMYGKAVEKRVNAAIKEARARYNLD